MTAVPLTDCRRAAFLSVTMIVAAAVVAAVVHSFAAAAMRAWLDFPFSGIPPELSRVIAILLNNLRLLAALFAGAVVAQLAVRTGARGMAPIAWICDAIVVVGCVVHVLLVGATVGAYGDRGVAALLPHGPVELAGFSLGLSVYVAARRERLALPRALGVAGLAVLVLTVAAVLEVMVG